MKNKTPLALVGLGICVVATLGILKFKGGSSDDGKESSAGASSGKSASSPTAGAPAVKLSIGGTVKAANGDPLSAVVTVLSESSPARPIVARADASGKFQLDGLLAGTIRVSAAAPGFVPSVSPEIDLQAGSDETIDLVLERGGHSVSGTIRDITGGPIASAHVRLTPVTGMLTTVQARSFSAISSDDGRFATNAIDGVYVLAAHHSDYVSSSRRVELRGGNSALDLELVPGAAVEGVVRIAGSGEPAAGAVVEYRNETVRRGLAGAMRETRDSGEVIADAAGRFRISSAGSGLLSLTAHTERALTSEPVEVPVGIGESVSGVEVFVGEAFRISGTVSAKDGKPAAGIAVTSRQGFSTRATVSGEDGSFSVGPVASGAYRMAAGERVGLDRRGEVDVKVVDRDVLGVALTHDGGAMIVGRVEPAAAAEVSVAWDKPGASMFSPPTRTDDSGRFEIGPAPPGTVPLRAVSDDGRLGQSSVSVGADGATGVVIRLADAAKLSGRVVNAAGKPQPGMIVTLRRNQAGSTRTVLVNGAELSARRGISAPDGSYRVLGLEAGDYALVVKNDRGQVMHWAGKSDDSPVKIALTDSEEKTGLTLAIEAEDAELRGQVLGPDGAPVVDAFVTATPTFEFNRRRRPPERESVGDGPERRSETMMVVAADDGDASISTAAPTVVTDADGRFVMKSLVRGNYDLTAEGLKGSARAHATKVATGSVATLKLRSLTTLSGVVTRDGKPVLEFGVELQGPTQFSRRFANADGTFGVTRLDPGNYRLVVRGGDGESETTVEVVEGKTTAVSVELQGQFRLRGKLLNAEGAAIEGAMVVLTPQRDDGEVSVQLNGDEPSKSGPDGSFEVRSLGGRFLLLALKPGMGGPLLMRPIELAGDLDLGELRADGQPPPPPGPPEEGKRQASR